jgi:DNA polymerase-3 subunit alpha
MEKFAAYGFNKPHSASYALIAYWTAYIKANYPVEFMTALLTAELSGVAGPSREIKMSQAIEECRRMDINVRPPDINRSQHSFTIEEDSIRFGLSAIKNVGDAAIESILTARRGGPFTSFKDFLNRIDLRKVNKKTVESLIKTGAFSAFSNRATLLAYYPTAVAEIARLKTKKEKGQFDLFDQQDSQTTLKDNFKVMPEFSEQELFNMERDIIGFLIGRNPLSKFSGLIAKKTTKKIGDIAQQDVNRSIIIAGIISQIKLLKTKSDNSEMAILHLFDETGSIEVVAFPKIYSKLKKIIGINKIIMLKGTVNERDGRLGVILENGVDLEMVNLRHA